MRRRQKKVLSLVLCVAMMLSVMVVGAGAAFSDQSKIKNTEAVDACTALNIIGGYPDGSFKPEGNITRAEVTKMICVALNGGKEPNLATNATPTFSDVRTNANSAWAEKYIESCYAQGIVSGVGGGKFAPAGNVTGTQLAKMLLVSLGYNPDIEKFTGNAWATNVNIIATQKGLYEGLESIDVSAALTRDNAAQMIWNALKAGEVKYEYTLVSENGTLVSKTTLENKKGTDGKDLTMLKDKYSVTTREDVTLKTISKDDKGTYSVTTSGTAGKDVSYTKVEKNYSDLMGQKVDVLVKDNDNSKVFGIYANEDSTVVATGVVGDLDTVNGSTEKVKFNDVEYKLDTNNSVITFNKTAPYASDLRTLAANASGAEKAYAIKLIDNDSNGKIDTAVVTPFTVAEVTYAGSSSYTFRPVGGKLTTIGNIDSDDVNAYKGIAKDDYAIVYADTDTVSGDWEVVQADKVTGKVTATKSSDTKGKIDGKWYESLVRGQTFSLNDTVDAYIAGGYAFQVEVSESGATSADAVFVDAVEVNTTGLKIGLKAKLYFTDGTSKEAKISKVDNKKVVTSSTSKSDEVYYANTTAAESALKDKIFTYSMDGDKYELKSITSSNKCGYKGVEVITEYTDKNLNYSDGSMKISDDAVLFVKGNDDTKVMTGKQVNAWGTATKAAKATSQVMYSESNGFKYAKVGALVMDNIDIPDASGDTAYGYLTSDLESTKEGSTNYYSFTMWTEKGEKTVRAKTGEVTNPETIEKGDFITYNIGDGETVSDVAKITNYGAVTAYAQGSVDINLVKADGNTISDFKNKLADTAKIIYVNTKDKKGVEGGSITVAADDSNGVKIANVVYVIAAAGDDDANKITWLFVDTNNDLEKVTNPVDAAKATNEATVDTAIAALKTAAADTKTASSATEVTLASNLPDGTTATLGNAGTTTINNVAVEGTSLKATAPTAIVAGKVVVKVTVTAGTGVTAVSKTVAIEYTVAAAPAATPAP